MENPQLWLLLTPLFLIQFGLQIFSFIHLYRRRAAPPSKLLWVAVIIFFGILGCIVYFILSKEE